MRTVVTYESFHGSAKKMAEIIGKELDCNVVNIDTPFEVEDMSQYDSIIICFNFRGPYTAQLTKLYLNRVKDQYKGKHVFLVGEGLFSEKEFPVVAEEIHSKLPCASFHRYFVKGQLRVATLSKEEKALLAKFSEITKMVITDMGEFDEARALEVAKEIKETLPTLKIEEVDSSKSETKWKCPACGYIHTGDNPPENCPLCGLPGSSFVKVEE